MNVLKIALWTAALYGLTTAAEATTVLVTTTGTVTSGIDTAGLFGVVGADLTGKSYTGTYSFTLLTTSEEAMSDVRYMQARGKGAASFTINGNSVASSPPFSVATIRTWGDVDLGDHGETYAVYGSLDTDNPDDYVYETASSMLGIFGGSLGKPFSYAPGAVNYAGPGSGEFHRLGTNLLFSTTTITSEGGVPEPGTWTMLVVGFALVGGSLRLRRNRPVGAKA